MFLEKTIVNNQKILEELEDHFTDLLFHQIDQKASKGPRTYGFEYEFIPLKPLNLEIMERLYRYLPEHGFAPAEQGYLHPTGVYINFEPGGQIEYHSLPLLSEDDQMFYRSMELIERTNSIIHQDLGIEYLATGYIPGRADSPLCLTSKRYRNLHARMPKCGSRGLEMMKGTASIHLHARICDIRELAPLFASMCKMALMEDFKMGRDRRDIWDNTDPSRCGLPYRNIEDHSDTRQVVKEIVKFALKAEDIGENVPFYRLEDISFDAFMYHMTTIFTDVRLNIKGPSIELRTLDSMPFPPFQGRWKRFMSLLKDVSVFC